MSALQLALLTLWRKRSSALIALFSIALAVACSGLLLRLYTLSESRFQTWAPGPDALVGAKTGGIEMLLNALNEEGPAPGYLPLKLYQSLSAQQDVQFEDGAKSSQTFSTRVIPFVYFAKTDGRYVIGSNSALFAHLPSPIYASGTWANGTNEVVLGSAFAKAHGLGLGDTILVQAWAGDDLQSKFQQPLKIVGVLNPSGTVWDQSLFSNLTTAHAALASLPLGQLSIWGADVLNYFFIDLASNGGPALEALINKRTVGQVVFVEKEKAQLQKLSGLGQKMGLSMILIVLLMGSLSVASMLLSRFDAMSGQIAVLRALGYQKSFLFRWLTSEGLILGGAAVLIGAALDALLFPFLRQAFGQALPGPELVSSTIWVSSPVWILALLVTVVAVFIPLLRLSQQSVHQALRG